MTHKKGPRGQRRPNLYTQPLQKDVHVIINYAEQGRTV